MKSIKAVLYSLGFFLLVLYPQDVFSGENVLIASLHSPNVCSQSAIDDFEPISQQDLFVPKDFQRKGPELPLLTDEELDDVNAEGFAVIFRKVEAVEPAIILWDEAVGTVTDYYGYGEIHVERR